jgi:hypothetical protein
MASKYTRDIRAIKVRELTNIVIILGVFFSILLGHDDPLDFIVLVIALVAVVLAHRGDTGPIGGEVLRQHETLYPD